MSHDDGYPVECPQCGDMALHYDCWDCGGEGTYDAYEKDPLWYDPGDVERCGTCKGRGGWTVCRSCGYDSTKGKPQKGRQVA